MKKRAIIATPIAVFVLSLSLLVASSVHAQTVCTLIVDVASGDTLHQQGDCDRRVTPASTFKIPLAAMGFDSGFLVSSEQPRLSIASGEPDWGGAAWRQETGPAHWMRHSVVWYSQRIARVLGAEKLTAYARAFGYGNADFSGDPGQNNGLERAWISSSLLISPREQVDFLRNLLGRKLPVDAASIDRTIAIVESHAPLPGWTVWGKTGSAYPRRADGSFDRQRGWGWFVGWAAGDNRLLVFARLTQNDGTGTGPDGLRTRDRLLAEWDALTTGL